jgi:MFS family permease
MTNRIVILVSCMLGLAVSFAPVFNIAVFLKPLTAEFGWSRAQVSGGGAVSMLAMAGVAPWTGRLIDRAGPRRVVMLSSLALAGAVALMAANRGNYTLFVLNAALIGIAGAGTTPLAYLALVARWFDKRLGLALGVTMMGVGIGLAASPLLATYLLSIGGLQLAFLGMSAIAATGAINAAIFLREPQPTGVIEPSAPYTTAVVAAEGDEAGLAASSVRPVCTELRELAASRQFWTLLCAMALMTTVVAGVSVHFVAIMTDRGWTAVDAAATAGLIGLSVMVGRLLAGVILDYVPSSLVGSVTFACGTAGVAALAAGWSGWVPVLAAIGIGLAQGAEGDLIAFVVKRLFRPESYGLTYGLIFAAFNLGAFGGPLMLGIMFDVSGTYAGGLTALTALGLAATLLITRVSAGNQQRGTPA